MSNGYGSQHNFLAVHSSCYLKPGFTPTLKRKNEQQITFTDRASSTRGKAHTENPNPNEKNDVCVSHNIKVGLQQHELGTAATAPSPSP